MKVRHFIHICLVLVILIVATGRTEALVTIQDLNIGYESPTTSTATVYFDGTPPYSIYRSTDGLVWGTPIATGLTNVSYKDTGLANYYNYFYKISDSSAASALVNAFPPNNNPHGLYVENTPLCAACHITHTASGGRLLLQATVVALCTTCHDGTQSKYDVRNGKVRLSNLFADTSGGAFGPLQTTLPTETAVYNSNYASLSVAEVTYDPTSIHNLGTFISQAPGGVSDRQQGLACIDCHDPHGNSGNYRNLKKKILVNGGISVNVDFKAYARTDNAQTHGYGEDIYYETGSIFFCSACHSDYNQSSGSGSTAATGTQVPGLSISPMSMNKFIHSVNTPLIYQGEYMATALPLEGGTGVNVVVCLTCHQAHGTFKTGVSKINNSTSLIRLDRQAVCEECHKK